MGNLNSAGCNPLQIDLKIKYELSGKISELQIELHPFGCIFYSVIFTSRLQQCK